MSKIICDVCGTSYPEASAQCPICGCVRPVDAPVVAATPKESVPAAPYQHVKGGRFSKANVRKRNMNPQQTRENANQRTYTSNAPKSTKKRNSSNVGLVITIFVLLIAILAVIAFIVVKLWGGGSAADASSHDQYALETSGTSETVLEIPCRELLLDTEEYSLSDVGQKTALRVTASPDNTTDKFTYTSNNEAVVTVDDNGILTATGYGEATVTIQCGAMSAQCYVTVMPPFELEVTDVILDAKDQEQEIYAGQIDVEEITWSTDDPAVATIENGVVTAVAAGSTTVHGEYNGKKLSCTVTCNIVDETEPEETTADSEEPQTPTTESYKGPFKLKNLMGGRNDDVSLVAGESFQLALVDANGDTVKGVTWSVKNGNACTVSEGTVKAVALGYTEVVATYNGETYICIVRVR